MSSPNIVGPATEVRLQSESDAGLATDPQGAIRRRRLKKLVISVVTVSIAIHLLGGVAAFFWVVARYFKEPKAQFEVVERVAIKPDKREHRMETEEVSSLRPKPVFDNRIQSLRPTEFALPDIPELPLDQLVEIDTDNLINENMEVTESQSTEGSGTGGGFFGGDGKTGSGLLEGTFYDFKQTSDRKPTGMDPDRFVGIIKEFAGDFNTARFNEYYSVPRKLYLTQVGIPKIDADRGPRAFGVSGKVDPMMWLVHYRGKVSAPESGTYRFVGTGDDILLVRFNNQLVLDASHPGWDSYSRMDRSKRYPVPKASGMESFYIGTEFSVAKGETYPIEIILGEAPGGEVYMALYIEKVGESYKKHREGGPILPLFQMVEKRVPSRIPKAAESEGLWKPVPTARTFFNTMP